MQRRSTRLYEKMTFFVTLAGTNETIFGFMISSWVVCAPGNGGAMRLLVSDFAGRGPAALRGTTLPSDRDSSTEPKRKAAGKAADKAKQGGGNKEMGTALRSVYEKTVNEPIPDEMMDLLGKLG